MKQRQRETIAREIASSVRTLADRRAGHSLTRSHQPATIGKRSGPDHLPMMRSYQVKSRQRFALTDDKAIDVLKIEHISPDAEGESVFALTGKDVLFVHCEQMRQCPHVVRRRREIVVLHCVMNH